MKDKLLVSSLFLYFLIFFSCKSALLQSIEDTNINAPQIVVDARIIEVDELENIYLVTSDNEIQRYNPKGKLLFQFSNDRFGDIASLDVSNPHKILAYYPDYSLAISFDNTLSETFRYDLNEMDLWDITTVALSSDNKIWVYDPIEFKLKKIDEFGNALLEGYNLLDELNTNITAEYLIEVNNQVYLYDSNIGFLVFDDLSRFDHKIEIKSAQWFEVLNNKTILYKSNNSYYTYSEVQKQHIVRQIANDNLSQDFRDLKRAHKRWYLLGEGGVFIYN